MCAAHPARSLLEYIPWLRNWMELPVKLQGE
jgi:hypothetical protein